jgi:hypothetical protein
MTVTTEDLTYEKSELEAVLASGIFDRSPSLAQILTYVCQKHFEGSANQIKEYNIAVDALGRPVSGFILLKLSLGRRTRPAMAEKRAAHFPSKSTARRSRTGLMWWGKPGRAQQTLKPIATLVRQATDASTFHLVRSLVYLF